MNIQINTSQYNEKRYGKPWIAKVDFIDGKPVYHFGNWVGQNGYEGLLEIDAEINDVIATGQKDFRKPSNSAPDFYFVNENGELEKFLLKKSAYIHYKKYSKLTPSYDDLINRKNELYIEIKKINELLNVID